MMVIQGCEYHDLWDPVLDGPRAHWAYVMKRPDFIRLTRTFLNREIL